MGARKKPAITVSVPFENVRARRLTVRVVLAASA